MGGGPGEGGRSGKRVQGAEESVPAVRVETEGSVAVARIDVRVAVAPEPSGELLLVPPEEPDEPFADAEPTAPRRAADLLPPRDRRPEAREDRDTPPRAQSLLLPRSVSAGSRPEGNALPDSAPRPVFGQPLFAQEWSASPQGTPNWKPGAPPVDHEPSRGSWYVVGVVGLIGMGLILLWLHAWV